MQEIEQHLIAQLRERQQAGLLRQLPGPADGLADFHSNDYLGLGREHFAASLPAGGTGSRLISGNTAEAEALERKIAEFHRARAALLFNSGYAANTGLISCMATRHDTILYDELCHASIREGLLLSRAKSYRFAHNDAESLQRKLQRAQGRCFVVVESVYSMDGDEAPLAELLPVAEERGAALVLDEAHGTGVLGERGEGLAVEQGLEQRIWARIVTFGKAVGAQGAAVLGSDTLRQYLVNFSRPFIYTTAMPPLLLEAIRQHYVQMSDGQRTRQLREHIAQFQAFAKKQELELLPSRSAVQALLLPGNERAKAGEERLRASGFAVKAVLSPTVPQGRERLRICLHTFNTPDEIESLVQHLKQLSDEEA